MTTPAMWTIWGTRRYTVTRLPRYWLALLACRRRGHQLNMHYSAGARGCGRCHSYRESGDRRGTEASDGR